MKNKTNKNRYILDLLDGNDLKRIKSLIDKHYEILRILEKDSKESPEGGALPGYIVKISFEEHWI